MADANSPSASWDSGHARTDDGLLIHWRSIGQGPPVVMCNGVGVSTFFWKYLADDLLRDHHVVLWDYRGHGRSDRRVDLDTTDVSIRRHARDLMDVLDATGVDQPAVLIGHSMGCQVALEAWRVDAARVGGLVLALGSAGRTLHTFAGFSGSPRIFKQIRRAIEAAGPRVNQLNRVVLRSPIAWEFARRMALVDPYYTLREDLSPYLEHLSSMDLRLFLKCVLEIDEHDAWPELPNIDCPALVIAAERDAFTPIHCSREIAQTLPDAELFVLADGSHAALVEQPETFNHRIRRFLTERTHQPAPETAPAPPARGA
jgi:pimeloyl-ACP methyl ester carboxylesterase